MEGNFNLKKKQRPWPDSAEKPFFLTEGDNSIFLASANVWNFFSPMNNQNKYAKRAKTFARKVTIPQNSCPHDDCVFWDRMHSLIRKYKEPEEICHWTQTWQILNTQTQTWKQSPQGMMKFLSWTQSFVRCISFVLHFKFKSSPYHLVVLPTKSRSFCSRSNEQVMKSKDT